MASRVRIFSWSCEVRRGRCQDHEATQCVVAVRGSRRTAKRHPHKTIRCAWPPCVAAVRGSDAATPHLKGSEIDQTTARVRILTFGRSLTIGRYLMFGRDVTVAIATPHPRAPHSLKPRRGPPVSLAPFPSPAIRVQLSESSFPSPAFRVQLSESCFPSPAFQGVTHCSPRLRQQVLRHAVLAYRC